MLAALGGLLLCAPLQLNLTPGTKGNLVLLQSRAAETKPKKKQPADKAEVSDTKISDADSKDELPLLDLGLGGTSSVEAGVEALSGGGVTATGKADVNSAEKQADKSKQPDSLVPLWTLNSGRFLIGEHDSSAIKPKAKATDKQKTTPAKSNKVKTQAKPAKSTAAKTKPAVAKPKPAPAKPKTAPAASGPVTVSTETVLDTASQAALSQRELKPSLPPGETLVDVDNPPLADYFADEGQESETSDSVLTGVDSAAPEDNLVASGTAPVGVIATRRTTPQPQPSGKTIGALLREGGSEVGSNVVSLSPWRSGSIVLLCLAFIFAGMWATGKLKGRLPGGPRRSMALIESINVAPGRQICIVELGQEALVLGVTPQSINLLDKLPLEGFSEGYSRTVQTIINREATSLPSEWTQRPAFAEPAALRAAQPLPQPQRYGGGGEPVRMRVSELRQSRTASQPWSGGSVKPARTGQAYDRKGFAKAVESRLSKDELISRLRTQIDQLER